MKVKVLGASIQVHGQEVPAYVEKSPWWKRVWFWARGKQAPIKVVTYKELIDKAHERLKQDEARCFYGLSEATAEGTQDDAR